MDSQPLNSDGETLVSWETCSLRSFLNETFYNYAFSSREKRAIVTTVLENDYWNLFGNVQVDSYYYEGEPTADKVFILRRNDLYKYFSNDTDRICQATLFAKAQGVYTNNEGGRWLLRSPGSNIRIKTVFFVDTNGSYCSGTYYISTNIGTYTIPTYMNFNNPCGIRPAIWVDLSQGLLTPIK